MWGIPMFGKLFGKFFRPALIIGTLPVTLQNGTTADATQVMSDLNFIVNQVNANAAALAAVLNAFSGNMSIAGTLSIGGTLTYGGVTLNNAVTGTGNMVLSASPTLTGTAVVAAVSASGNITEANNVAFQGKNTGGTAVDMLVMDGNNIVKLRNGATGEVITVPVIASAPAAAAARAGGLIVDGTTAGHIDFWDKDGNRFFVAGTPF